MEEFNYDLDRMKIAVNSPTVKLELYRMNREILQIIDKWSAVRYEAGNSIARTIEQEVKKYYGLTDE